MRVAAPQPPPRESVGTANIRFTLSPPDAHAAIRKVLRETAPGFLVVTEQGRLFDGDRTVWRSMRPESKHPTSQVIYDASRYHPKSCRAATLVPSGFVGRLPGRKSTLPASVATIALFEDVMEGGEVVIVGFHLTAEVQRGKGYRATVAHKLRVLRHKAERLALSLRVRRLRRDWRRVFAAGDTNYDGMTLPPLTSCWDGHGAAEARGTLGNRAVDIVYAQRKSKRVETVKSASDHRAVVAYY